jgi:hypothetical protein
MRKGLVTGLIQCFKRLGRHQRARLREHACRGTKIYCGKESYIYYLGGGG